MNDNGPQEARTDGDEPTDGSGRHRLAIGYYIGSLVLALGVIIALAGAFGPVSASQQRLGFDIAVWWGLVMAVFGAVFLLGSRLSRRR